MIASSTCDCGATVLRQLSSDRHSRNNMWQHRDEKPRRAMVTSGSHNRDACSAVVKVLMHHVWMMDELTMALLGNGFGVASMPTKRHNEIYCLLTGTNDSTSNGDEPTAEPYHSALHDALVKVGKFMDAEVMEELNHNHIFAELFTNPEERLSRHSVLSNSDVIGEVAKSQYLVSLILSLQIHTQSSCLLFKVSLLTQCEFHPML